MRPLLAIFILDDLPRAPNEGIDAGCTPEFTAIAVSDGIAMGHEGMKASLVSQRGDRRFY